MVHQHEITCLARHLHRLQVGNLPPQVIQVATLLRSSRLCLHDAMATGNDVNSTSVRFDVGEVVASADLDFLRREQEVVDFRDGGIEVDALTQRTACRCVVPERDPDRAVPHQQVGISVQLRHHAVEGRILV